jgi:hypothetical protein
MGWAAGRGLQFYWSAGQLTVSGAGLTCKIKFAPESNLVGSDLGQTHGCKIAFTLAPVGFKIGHLKSESELSSLEDIYRVMRDEI